jgi:hypothetical protein
MPDAGAALGVDLYWLSTVANDALPTVVDIYDDASRNADSAGEPAHGLMQRADAFGGGASLILTAWAGLHAATSRFLRDTGQSMEDTARALNLAIDQYTQADGTVKAAFDGMIAQSGVPRPDPVLS